MRGRDGEQVEARDVLDDWELIEYAASQRLKPRHKTPRGHQPVRIDELGYDQWGTWHPEYDPEAGR